MSEKTFFAVVAGRIAKAMLIAVLFVPVFPGTSLELSAQETYWEGGVSISPYGLLPRSGTYAASNAFPPDTKVEVTNAETGKSVEVRVVERLDDPHLFMLVSPEAGEALGIEEDEVVRATVEPAGNGDDLVAGNIVQEKAFSPDPDRNPSASVESGEAPVSSEGLDVMKEYLGEETPETGEEPTGEEPESPVAKKSPAEETPGPEEPAPDESSTEPGTEQPAVDADAVVAVPEAGTTAKEEGAAPTADLAFVAGMGGDAEVAKLPEPDLKEKKKGEEAAVVPAKREVAEGPLGDEVKPLFARQRDTGYAPVSPLPPETLEKAHDGPVASISDMENGGEQPVFAAAEPRLPDVGSSIPELAAAAPEETEVGSSDLPSPELAQKPEEVEEGEQPIAEGAEIVLKPAEERPPEGPPDSELTAAAEGRAQETPEAAEKEPETAAKPDKDKVDKELATQADLTKSLTKSSYYLQLAAYQKLDRAKELAVKLLPRYPVTIYNGEGETFPYKVMVGPLNEDESGALLYSFTSRGYRDAFLRRGN